MVLCWWASCSLRLCVGLDFTALILKSKICLYTGVIRLEDGTKIDDIPGGHLIQPKMEDIKSRHLISARHQKMPSGKYSTETFCICVFKPAHENLSHIQS